MDFDDDKVENAINSLREAMRIDVLVMEAAHFRLSDAAFREITKKAEELTEEAVKKMKEVQALDGTNGKKAHWTIGHYAPLAQSGVPCSLLHICIHEAATDIFEKPEPPENEDERDEYEFRAKFANWWEKHIEMLKWKG